MDVPITVAGEESRRFTGYRARSNRHRAGLRLRLGGLPSTAERRVRHIDREGAVPGMGTYSSDRTLLLVVPMFNEEQRVSNR